jgi:hypothetical protein
MGAFKRRKTKMKEFKEKHIVEYLCGCKHEIGLGVGGGFWIPTGNEQNCKIHEVKPNSSPK